LKLEKKKARKIREDRRASELEKKKKKISDAAAASHYSLCEN
jgi:hypothetical protein